MKKVIIKAWIYLKIVSETFVIGGSSSSSSSSRGTRNNMVHEYVIGSRKLRDVDASLPNEPSNIPSLAPSTSIPTSIPSRTEEPSIFPTVFPTLFLEEPSQTPSHVLSAPPSTIASSSPSSKPTPAMSTPDEWAIDFVKSFTNSSILEDGLFLEYAISKDKSLDQFVANLYDETCTTQADLAENSILINSKSITSLKDNHNHTDKGIIGIKINQTHLSSSIFYNETSEVTGTLSFCVKAELMLQNTSISFSKTSISLNIDLMSTIQIKDVVLQENEIENVQEDTKFTVTACLCDATLEETYECSDSDKVLTQNKVFHICVTPQQNQGLLISSFEKIILYQDNIAKFIAINQGIPSQLTTTKILNNGQIGIVQTRTISAFFDDPNPTPLTITGDVILALTSTTEDRRFRLLLNDERSAATFEIHANLLKEHDTFSLFSWDKIQYGILISLLMGAGFLLSFNHRHRNSKLVRYMQVNAEEG